MFSRWLLGAIAGMLSSQALVYAEYPPCLGLRQYELGFCCLQGLPCPSPPGAIATTEINVSITATGDAVDDPVQPTTISNPVTHEDGTPVTTSMGLSDGVSTNSMTQTDPASTEYLPLITTLPPGASIQTITGEFTEGTVITTTSPGGTGPTVVPVIVPEGGPPQIVCHRFFLFLKSLGYSWL